MTSTNITGITDSEYQREQQMTVINNNIKALIANQTTQDINRNSSASVSRLHPAKIFSSKAAAQAESISPAPSSTTTLMQSEISAASGITDLLIRLRELALQALNAIRPQFASELADHSHMKTVQTALSAFEKSCSTLVTQIDRIDLSQTIQNSPTNLEKTESQDHSIPNAQYAQSASALARAEIEQHAGKALLVQANQRPAFVMALLH